MKTKYIALIAVCIVPCIAGCVSNPTALSTVGPDTTVRARSEQTGYLEVFTATRTVDVDFEAYFNPHMGYNIEDASGQRIKFVANHTSDMDECPDFVALPPGSYRIVAESAWCGLVTVPVAIQSGKTTAVHLDGTWWRPSHASTNQLVYLPDGEAVGWSGMMPK
jgi:hypothetical protein